MNGEGKVVDIYFDGSSKPNSPTGKARIGLVFVVDDEVVNQCWEDIGRGTNNYAEFVACTIGISMALDWGFRKANVFGDSTLVINGMKGIINIKKASLLKVYTIAYSRVLEFDWITFTHIPRNTGHHDLADRLSKQ